MKLSIIVPIYNMIDSIETCLESIKGQTFKDFECILVDDGSTDGSSDFCDKFIKSDKRFRVIHKENEGVGIARNTGIDESKGEWIAFVDADDSLDNNCYEEAMKWQEKCDVIMFGCYKAINGFKFIENSVANNVLYDYSSRGTLPKRYVYIWDKIYKAELIKSHNIRFPNSNIGEDVIFLFNILAYYPKVYYITKCVYRHNPNAKSLTHYTARKDFLDWIQGWENLKKSLTEKEFSKIERKYKEQIEHIKKCLKNDLSYEKEGLVSFVLKIGKSSTVSNVKKLANFLNKQTYTNWQVFAICDNNSPLMKSTLDELSKNKKWEVEYKSIEPDCVNKYIYKSLKGSKVFICNNKMSLPDSKTILENVVNSNGESIELKLKDHSTMDYNKI